MKIIWLLSALFYQYSSCYKLPTFGGVDYYWPMTATNSTKMIDRSKEKVKADLHGVEFVPVKQLGYAASLRGKQQWIDVDAVIKDCLAFRFSQCNDNAVLSVAFWVRMRGGKRILATGSYTNSSRGPGVLFEYNSDTEMLHVEFANGKRLWQVDLMLRKYRWTHVIARWTLEKGLTVVFDGKLRKAFDQKGIDNKIIGEPYDKMITIGRPQNIYSKKEFGNFDIAFFLVYFRELIDTEIVHLTEYSMRKTLENDACCDRKLDYKDCERNPCNTRACLKIEEEFTDCICPDVYHEKCEAFPTSAPTTTPENCKRVFDAYTVTGCNNKKDKVSGHPSCNEKLCYYGNCKNTMGVNKCECESNCENIEEKHRVCGSNHVTYESYCVLTMDSCAKKELITVLYDGPCRASYKNATHYWPFNSIQPLTNEDVDISKDINNKQNTVLQNGVKTTVHQQLGQVLQFDGKDDWLDISKIQDDCITNVSCKHGISVSFWMKYHSGDNIMAAGGFYVGIGKVPGFRLERDKVNKFFKLEVATKEQVWRVYLQKLPMDWFHFAFTWKKEDGVKVFINGGEKLSSKGVSENTDTFHSLSRKFFSNDIKFKDYNRIGFAKDNSIRRHNSRGKFQFGHLAVWKKALNDQDVASLYKANVLMTSNHQSCCMKKLESDCKFSSNAKEQCICPDDDGYAEKCKNERAVLGPNSECRDSSQHCIDLIRYQKGYCQNFKADAKSTCYSSCQMCIPRFLASMSPQKHFSQETLIFALLGCVGGLLLLLGVTVYFWRVYRTRYHGAFVPPLKGGSKSDIREYDDEKWPTRYIDSSEYFIKDVPPKKRALPLIPAKNAQANHRYQPPEFD